MPAYGHARCGTWWSRLRGRLLTTAGRLLICDSCLTSFRRNPLESCDVCGVPWGVPGESDEEFAICPECREQRHAFERARRYGQYEGALVRAILLLRYARSEPLPVVCRALAGSNPRG